MQNLDLLLDLENIINWKKFCISDMKENLIEKCLLNLTNSNASNSIEQFFKLEIFFSKLQVLWNLKCIVCSIIYQLKESIAIQIKV